MSPFVEADSHYTEMRGGGVGQEWLDWQARGKKDWHEEEAIVRAQAQALAAELSFSRRMRGSQPCLSTDLQGGHHQQGRAGPGNMNFRLQGSQPCLASPRLLEGLQVCFKAQ